MRCPARIFPFVENGTCRVSRVRVPPFGLASIMYVCQYHLGMYIRVICPKQLYLGTVCQLRVAGHLPIFDSKAPCMRAVCMCVGLRPSSSSCFHYTAHAPTLYLPTYLCMYLAW